MFKFLQSPRFEQLFFAGILFILAAVALYDPFKQQSGIENVGWLLVWAALLVFIQGFRRSSMKERNSAHISALITLVLGFLLVNADAFVSNAMYIFAAVLFGADAFRQFISFTKAKKNGDRYIPQLFAFIGNLGVLLAILFFKGRAIEWLLSLTGGLRIAGMGIEILSSRIGMMKEVSEDVVQALGLQDYPEIVTIAASIEEQEASRAPVDRRWIITFLLILFFIHLGRMGFDRSQTGILSPFVALVGDVVIALIIAYAVLIPLESAVRKLFSPFEKRIWHWVLEKPAAERKGLFSFRKYAQGWMEHRINKTIRMRKAGYSFKTAFRTGMQAGLPYAALLAAIIPVFGMSWYFDTENWASGIWDSWAAKRTDTWRTAMVQSVEEHPGAGSFKIQPAGVTDSSSFSFLIIGDPGEGDASQYILHDQIVTTAEKDQVKFLVISSDVIYPDGSMKDYERNFWLPMKGVRKPVYTIPGNHDWYDALEGFAATFYDPVAAARSMQARRASDLHITAATAEKIENQVAEAARLRSLYQVPTGFQQAPYFQLQTKDFAFICVETGVVRRIDEVQMEWLKQTLEASKGKYIFVLLGHPFYAIGEYQGSMNPDFEALHQLLRDYGANIAMAGDTHDMEYYLEPLKGKDTGRVMHHFVNGGGGAYLSLGASLKPQDRMPEKVWAHYPPAAPFINKIEANNSWIKRPAWIWTKKYNGWPFSAEWLSAAFDYNKAPFFQSFMEIEINPSQNKIKLKAMGINGPLKWSEMEYSKGLKPAELPADAAVEWQFPLKQ
jgi:Calcineurin-like phosphoesterase